MIGDIEIISPKDKSEKWIVKNKPNKMNVEINLTFNPITTNMESKVVPGIVDIKLNQILGKYSGTIKINNKEERIDNLFGLLEDHISIW